MKLFSIRWRKPPPTAQANVREPAPQELQTKRRPVNRTVLPLRIDPGLGIDNDGAYYLEPAVETLTAGKTVLASELCPALLAAEVIAQGRDGPFIWVRAATADEVAWLYDIDGEIFAPAGESLTWQEAHGDEAITEPAVIVWNGEVIDTVNDGIVGPFYTDEAVAKAWAFSTALSIPPDQITAVQIVRYSCAKRFAPDLIAGGAAEYGRLAKFWYSPLRARALLSVDLPVRAPPAVAR